VAGGGSVTRAAEFHQAMVDTCQRTSEFGYNPSYFLREIANTGGVATVKALLAKRIPSDGFLKLWREGRLELSCEAYVITPYYAELFKPDEVARADERLRLFDFDVDAYLDRVGQDAP
jgi:hypothetical protein